MNKEQRQAIRTLAAQHDYVLEGRVIREAREQYGDRFPRWMIDLAATAKGKDAGMTPAVPALVHALRSGSNAVAICGPANTGKTFAALRWAAKHHAMWLPASDLPARWDETKPFLVSAAKATALVVDDLFGAGSHGPVALDTIRVIIARRHDARLPTVITSSCTPEDLAAKLGPQASRVAAVLVEHQGEWAMTGDASRGDTLAAAWDLLRACQVYTDDVEKHEHLALRLLLDSEAIRDLAATITDADNETLTVLRDIQR